MSDAVRLGLTAADAFDACADMAEFAAHAHEAQAVKLELLAVDYPSRAEIGRQLTEERAQATQGRVLAAMFRERANIVRAHDDAITRRTRIAPPRPWWRFW